MISADVLELGQIHQRAGDAHLVQPDGGGQGLTERELSEAPVGQAPQVVGDRIGGIPGGEVEVDARFRIFALGQLALAAGDQLHQQRDVRVPDRLEAECPEQLPVQRAPRRSTPRPG